MSNFTLNYLNQALNELSEIFLNASLHKHPTCDYRSVFANKNLEIIEKYKKSITLNGHENSCEICVCFKPVLMIEDIKNHFHDISYIDIRKYRCTHTTMSNFILNYLKQALSKLSEIFLNVSLHKHPSRDYRSVFANKKREIIERYKKSITLNGLESSCEISVWFKPVLMIEDIKNHLCDISCRDIQKYRFTNIAFKNGLKQECSCEICVCFKPALLIEDIKNHLHDISNIDIRKYRFTNIAFKNGLKQELYSSVKSVEPSILKDSEGALSEDYQQPEDRSDEDYDPLHDIGSSTSHEDIGSSTSHEDWQQQEDRSDEDYDPLHDWQPPEDSSDEDYRPIKRRREEERRKMRKKIAKRAKREKKSHQNTTQDWQQSEDSSDEDCDPLPSTEKSEYEKMIEQNKAIKLAFLESLDIDEIKESFCQAVQDLKPKHTQMPKTKPVIEERTVPSRKCKTRCINLSEEALLRSAYGKDFPFESCEHMKDSMNIFIESKNQYDSETVEVECERKKSKRLESRNYVNLSEEALFEAHMEKISHHYK